MFERFTTEARSIVVGAQEEARLLKHNYIGTEHLLLAMLRPETGTAAVLRTVGIGLEPTRAAVVEIIGEGGSPSPSGHIPFTPRSKKVLELSLREAIKVGDNSIRAEHVLLGLVREGEGVAAQVLVQQGAPLDRVREAAMARLAQLARSSTGPYPALAGRSAGARTPAADNALTVAGRLAATGPVGSHHLLEALARSPESAAARVLAALGVDAEAVAAKIDEVGLDGTTDLTPTEAAARRVTVRLEGDAAEPAGRRVVIELGDEHTVGLVDTIIAVTGGPLRGDDAVGGSLVGLWEAVAAELASVAEHLAGPPDEVVGDDGGEGGVLGPVRAAVQGRIRRRRRPPS